MIRYVLFDVDDTLLDFGKAEAAAIRKTFERIGIPVTDELIRRYSEINAQQWSRFEKGEITREKLLTERFDILFSELGINVPSEMAQASYEYLLGIGHYFVDGAEELLEALKYKYELYIVSNGNASVQDRRQLGAISTSPAEIERPPPKPAKRTRVGPSADTTRAACTASVVGTDALARFPKRSAEISTRSSSPTAFASCRTM